jgi:hypothetical protein
MLEKYPFISTDWLLFGKGSMYKEAKMQSLFDDMPIQSGNADENTYKKVISGNDEIKLGSDILDIPSEKNQKMQSETTELSKADVIKIVWFYRDNTFEEYYPRR